MIEKSVVGFLFAKTRKIENEEEKKMSTVQQARARPPSLTLLQVKRDPVKLTALLYLREALQKQDYEECVQFISVAKEFGAQEREIEELLEDTRRIPR